MLLIPIGQEQNTVRRAPFVTYGIMLMCAIAFVLTGFGSPPMDPEAGHALDEAVQFYLLHPYLELDSELEALLFRGANEQARQAFIESAKEFAEKKPHTPFEVAQQQDKLDKLTRKGLAGLNEHGFFKWGLVPSKLSPISLVTHMFLHGGWMHLLGNMLILFLAGPFVEDVWGRPLFAGFYLVSGLVAALSFILLYPDSATPMIGASGAIAGIMGAFMIRHWHSRIRFFYMVGFIWRGTFYAPAWLMLPLWFGEQLFMMLMVHGLDGGSSGVAYMAHVGGFAFGALAAFAIQKSQFEERFITASIEDKITVVDNSVIEKAAEADRAGRSDEAYGLLAEAWRQDPSNIDLTLSLWDLALRRGWAAHAAPAMLHLIETMLRKGEAGAAFEHWFEVIGRLPDLIPEPGLSLRVGQALQRAQHADWARDAFHRCAKGPPDKLSTSMLVRLALQCRELDPNLSAASATAALERRDLQPAERTHAEQLVQASIPQPAG